MPAGLPRPKIEQCLSEGLDSDAARYARAATEALQPPHTWVPWVTVDGIPINSKQMGEAAHIARAVCHAYSGPTLCVTPPHPSPPCGIMHCDVEAGHVGQAGNIIGYNVHTKVQL